jgi:hypothetical protein
MLVEVNHENLILLVAGAGKRQGSRNNFRALRSHAPTIINHQADCDRNIFVAKRFDFLEDSVLVNPKVFFAEPGNRIMVAVLHGSVQDHQVNIYLDRFLVVALVIRTGRRLPGLLRLGKAWQNNQEKKQGRGALA